MREIAKFLSVEFGKNNVLYVNLLLDEIQ